MVSIDHSKSLVELTADAYLILQIHYIQQIIEIDDCVGNC